MWEHGPSLITKSFFKHTLTQYLSTRTSTTSIERCYNDVQKLPLTHTWDKPRYKVNNKYTRYRELGEEINLQSVKKL